jgi:Na+/melibiose symporter-like transporter
MAVIGRMTLLAYYVIYVVGSFTMIAPIFTSMTVFQLIGSMLLPVATKKFGKRNWLLILSLISIISIFVLFLFPSGNTAFLLTTAAFIGLSNSAGSVSTGMLSDCVEYGDWKYRVRDEGLTFSFLGFGVKLASAIAGAGGVLMLSATGYVPGAVQSQASITGINVVVNLVPAILMVLSILPLYWYKLDKKQMDQIAVELEIRELEEN